MVKLCQACGTPVIDDQSSFCVRCGNKISTNKALPQNKMPDQFSGESKTPVIILHGVNGQVELFNNKIIIKRAGVMAKLYQGFFKGEKTLYIDQISGIQIKRGSIFVYGYIQFVLKGSQENKGGLFDSTHDENTVMFQETNNKIAIEIRERIEELRKLNSRSPILHQSLSNADEIRKFKKLLDDGIITQEEFNKKKKEFLGL
jgi:hypothetical protein